MCGFVCRAARDGAAATGTIDAAMRSLHHRGPDSARCVTKQAGEWVTDLGALRLRIIDLRPESDMPMESADGSVTLIYNGELYNTDVLRAELERKGHVFVGDSDTECVLHLYEDHREHPERLLPELRGMFAFAVWDAQHERVFAARDRVGIKPLVYAVNGEQLVMASEARALVTSGLVSSSLSTDAAREYLRWGVVTGQSTLFDGIRRLPPATYLTYAGGRLTERTWWQSPRATEPALADPGNARRLMRSVLADAVERHLISDRPIGLFLSGGTDSQVIAALAARRGPISAFTLSFPDDADLDETADARATAARLGLDHVVVPVTEADLEDQILAFVGSLDSPSMDALNSWFVCRAASSSGLVVALSGLGADELVGTYPSFTQVPRVQRLGLALSTVPRPARLALARAVARRRMGSRTARVLEAGPTAHEAYAAVRSTFSAADFAPGVVAPSGPTASLRNAGRANADVVSALEFDHFLACQLLPDVDSVSMAHSLEVRVPFLDHLVVEAVLAIPQQTRRALGKRLLLDAAQVEARPVKRGFSLPMERWLRGPLRDFTRRGLLSDELPFADLIPAADRARLHDQFVAGRVHWSRPWSVAVLRHWPAINGVDAS